MKKIFISIVCCTLMTIVSIPSFAIIYPGISYISDDQIMSQLLPKGKIDVSAKVEYWSPYEEYIENTDGAMEPLAVNKSSYVLLNIPIMVSYGIKDNLSLRFTTQYINRNVAWTDFGGCQVDYVGYGLGDSKIEMLYQIAKETSDNPSIAVNVGTDILTGVNYIALPDYNATDTSLSTGLWGPSYYLSGIFGKKYGKWNGKAMIGYIFPAADKGSSWTWTMPSQLICSLSMSTKAGKDLEYGGELSAKFSGEEGLDFEGFTDPTDIQARSTLTRISVSPFVVYKQSKSMSIKGVLEIPLAMKGSASTADFSLNQFRGINISMGIDWAI